MSALLHTPLFSDHQRLNGKIVDFGGWALPVNYGSQIEEHHAVRKSCGIFDVSHMMVTEVNGKDCLAYLSYILANDIGKIRDQAGRAMYSCMLNNQGGVIDDLIVYFLSDQHCRIVSNAGTRKKVTDWFANTSKTFEVTTKEQSDCAIIAVQGPKAKDILSQRCFELTETMTQLKRFYGANTKQNLFVGRTGYTGEDGFELILNRQQASSMWHQLIDSGARPCGLGARDTLRLEAGMALYGNDLDEQHTPLESGLAWTVNAHQERQFIGKSALLKEPKYALIGLILEDRGVLRAQQEVYLGANKIGTITSGGFSPTLEKSIALGRIDNKAPSQIGSELLIKVRDKMLKARIEKYPFVSKSKTGE